jgi:hypothetical protein
MEIFNLGPHVEIIFAVKGLRSEGIAVSDELYSFLPEMIVLGISPEEVKGLLQFVDDPFNVPMGDYEVIYGTILTKFGEVEMPPPMYTQAVIYAKKREVELMGLDMDEESYGKAYEDNFNTVDMVRYIRRKRRMMRHTFDLSSPETFVMQWKELMEDNRSLRKMEETRLNSILENLNTVLEENKERRIVAVIEYEMMVPVRENYTSEMES